MCPSIQRSENKVEARWSEGLQTIEVVCRHHLARARALLVVLVKEPIEGNAVDAPPRLSIVGRRRSLVRPAEEADVEPTVLGPAQV